MRPFFDIDIDAGLLVKPIIVRLPTFTRICEPNVEDSDDLRDQFVDLAQGDLGNRLA